MLTLRDLDLAYKLAARLGISRGKAKKYILVLIKYGRHHHGEYADYWNVERIMVSRYAIERYLSEFIDATSGEE